MRYLVLLLITIYQQTISPDHGLVARATHRDDIPHSCRFTPTYSEYGFAVIARYGSIVGGILAIWRIIRCNPWSTPMGTYEAAPTTFRLVPLNYYRTPQ